MNRSGQNERNHVMPTVSHLDDEVNRPTHLYPDAIPMAQYEELVTALQRAYALLCEAARLFRPALDDNRHIIRPHQACFEMETILKIYECFGEDIEQAWWDNSPQANEQYRMMKMEEESHANEIS
jgi:hypothetical protein